MGIVDRRLSNRRVLLAEDEPILAELVREWLQDAGVTVVGPVAAVDRALALIEGGEPIDAAILDVNLLDGKPIDPVLLKLAARGVPYLLVTGDRSVVDRPWYWDRPCLDKPLSERALIEALQELFLAGPMKVGF